MYEVMNARVDQHAMENADDVSRLRQHAHATTPRRGGRLLWLSTHCELGHDGLHPHELLVLKGEHRLVVVEVLQLHAVRVECVVVVGAELLANVCKLSGTHATSSNRAGSAR